MCPLIYKNQIRLGIFMSVFALLFSSVILAAPGASAPERAADEGEGPYERLILRGVNLISGDGAPIRGPVDIVIEKNRITNIVSVGHPGVPIKPAGRPIASANDKEMELNDHYVMPGFIDMHGHIGGSADDIPAEYVFKLWLAHGITTVREPGSFNGLDWVLDHVERSGKNRIVAPRLIHYLGFGMDANAPLVNHQQARK